MRCVVVKVRHCWRAGLALESGPWSVDLSCSLAGWYARSSCVSEAEGRVPVRFMLRALCRCVAEPRVPRLSVSGENEEQREGRIERKGTGRS